MAKTTITVRVLTSQWANSDAGLELAGGEHEVTVDAKTLQTIGSAVHAGALEIVKASRDAKTAMAKHLGDEKAEAKAVNDRIFDQAYQERLEPIRQEFGPKLSKADLELVEAIDAGDQDAIAKAVQAKVDLEAEYHYAIGDAA